MLASSFALQRCSQHQLSSGDLRHGRPLRLISLGIAWFYIALIVESSFIPITDVIMEHRVYLPSAGFFIALAAVAQLASLKFQNGVRYKYFALTAVCLFFSLMTIERNRLWSDDVRFWQDAVEKSPRKGRVLSQLGCAYLNHGKPELAIPLFVNALKLDPKLSNTWMLLGSSLNGVNIYQGRFTSGKECLTPTGGVDYRWYSRLDSIELNNMGLANEFIGQPEEALTWYIQSVNMYPDFDLAWFNLGLLSVRFGHKGQSDDALLKLKSLNHGLADKLADHMRTGASRP
jgi:tetratricopeptide (TPR) repeat protein